MPKSEKPKTQFEQVPLKIVKEIAKEDIPGEEENGNGRIDESPEEVRAYSRVSDQE